MLTTRKSRPRDPEASRQRILGAARREFAAKGLAGARVDTIAARARINKRMIYHYFGNKEDLFRLVIEEAYADIREAETRLELDRLDPIAALVANAEFVWQYYLDNPDFITLVNSENLNKARHLQGSRRIRDMSGAFVDRMKRLLERGVAAGVFRRGLDPVQVNITIAAVGYYYLTNRFTGSIIYERDLMQEKALAERQEFNTRTILSLVCTPEALAGMEGRP